GKPGAGCGEEAVVAVKPDRGRYKVETGNEELRDGDGLPARLQRGLHSTFQVRFAAWKKFDGPIRCLLQCLDQPCQLRRSAVNGYIERLAGSLALFRGALPAGFAVGYGEVFVDRGLVVVVAGQVNRGGEAARVEAVVPMNLGAAAAVVIEV